MALEDALESAKDDEPLARTEFDGAEGYIQTAAESDDFDPTDLDGILVRFGYDPSAVQIVGPARISKWQQRNRIRGTSDYEVVWLTSYRFRIVSRGLPVDLPALYAEVKATRVRKPKPSAYPSTTVVAWSDIQVGKVDHLGSLKELLERLDDKRAALDAYLKRTKPGAIVLADCGDIIEGFSNYPAQHRNNALSLMAQVDVASTELWKTIKVCASHARTTVLSIPSNHCAWRREGRALAGKPGDDWGLHISERLERMADEVGLGVKFVRSAEWDETLQHEVRPGIRLGLVHGHQVSNPDGIRAWWAKMSHAGVLNCDVLLSGHFHFASLRPSGRDHDTGRSRWHIQAPTLDNGSAWVRNKHGEDGDPALCVFAINDQGFDVTSFSLL